ncbi:UNVERIFIED_CONTAM: hypothetical protein ABIC26_005157, partial [Paenibacillus sp. PvR008]
AKSTNTRKASNIKEYLKKEKEIVKSQLPETEGTGDLDYKEWSDMPISGEVRLNAKGMRLLSIKEQKQYIRKMKDLYGIEVQIDRNGKILSPTQAGGFHPEDYYIVLQGNPSILAAEHEAYHVAQWNKLGKEKYLEQSTLQREEHVYNEIMKNKSRYSDAEILEAQKYIYYVRNGQWPLQGWKGFEE